ncbi:CinA family protein [Trueperella pecoris]|uniref:CinA family protein n=1 Tax=Trueperella pecoris TaxID=2733571 RepID=A0A7M1R2N2_9ACTO|nr:CinA family protein [Trueperella pecoris]QOR48413.1 CinA family protein [Trueperella pecoris]
MKINDAFVRVPAILAELSARGMSLAVAESLTGGRLASMFVSVPGASTCFRGGVVAYATQAKSVVLGVSAVRLEETGPVDGVVAEQMAAGVAALMKSDYGLATTGVAGPGPADGHEAGTVWVGLSTPAGTSSHEFHFDGNRESVRNESVLAAITVLAEALENNGEL